MARIWTSSLELQSTSNGMEWDSKQGPGTWSISTSVKRTGSASLNIAPSSTTVFMAKQVRSASSNKIFIKFALYISSMPSGGTTIMGISNIGITNQGGGIVLNSDGTLILIGGSSTGYAQVGSASSALSTGTWYVIEMSYDDSHANNTLVAKLDGTQFATGNGENMSGNAVNFILGSIDSDTCNLYFDDIEINDDQGSYENDFPGLTKVICLRPNAAGDSAQFTRRGTDSGANWSQVEETTPDDATTYVDSTTLNHTDMFNMDACGLNSYDTIKCVQVGVRYASNSAINNPGFKLQVIKTSGGTVAQGSEITPNATAWKTDANASPKVPTLTLYQDPDGSAWTNTTLDSMQCGYKITTDNTNSPRISAIWAYVSYLEGTPPASGTVLRSMMGYGL